jgi:hypothetical protein
MRMAGFRANKQWSRLAHNFLVAVMTFAIGVAANLVWTAARPQHAPAVDSASARPGTLRRRILDAKSRGQNKVKLGILACGWDIGGLQEALSRDTVVLADLIGKKTYEDTDGLHTWYKFKTKDILVEHLPPYPAILSSEGAPSDLLPIAQDEFVISEINGQMEIDGITVIQSSNGAVYSEDQTYLLFLWIDRSKRTAIRTGTDPVGVFLVDSEGNLRSYLDRSYPLKTELGERFKNSVGHLRQALKNR